MKGLNNSYSPQIDWDKTFGDKSIDLHEHS